MTFIACDMYTGNASEIWQMKFQVPEIGPVRYLKLCSIIYHHVARNVQEIPGFPAL